MVVVANSSTKPIYYGNKVHLLCTYEKPISGCRFIIPGETSDILLESQKNSSENAEKYQYFGNGFETGECGITIFNATKENEGYAKCILKDYNNAEQSETVEVKIFDFNDHLHMGLPKMKIINSGSLKVNQTLVAECVTKSIHQYSDILWLLDDRILETFTTKRLDHVKGEIFELQSILKLKLDVSDNGRSLKCRSRISNLTQEFVDTSLDLVVLNETRLIEPKIGMPFDISIQFYSYPRFTKTKWRVNDTVIYYRNTVNEFVSREIKSLKNQHWEAVLHITNITELNMHYNYTLEVYTSSERKEEYHYRLDNLLNESDEDELPKETTIQEEKTTTTIAIPFIDAGENSITSSPKIYSTKQHQQHQKGEKLNMFRGTTARYSPYKTSSSNTIHPTTTERKTKKYTRKQLYYNRNTSVSMTEMTSVTSTSTTTTTTESPHTESTVVVVVMTKEHTNESTTEAAVIDENSLKSEYHEENTTFNRENNVNEELNGTTNKSLIEITTIVVDDGSIIHDTNIERLLIKIVFILMTLIIAISIFMLCHYRHQVTILKTEIIQMNLENYYNQSCLYPSTFNEYSSTNFQQQADEAPFYIKRPLNTSSGDSDTSSNQFLSTYNTNSHLYQSIDADDIDNHVYDEIIHTKESDDEKPNNYENNESLNSRLRIC